MSVTYTGARVLDPASGRDEVVPVTVADDVITRIGGKPGASTVDLSGYTLIPGLVDMRVSTGEPGEENRETIASAARAAAKGGITTMVLAPKTQPVIDDQSLVEFVRRRGETAPVQVEVAGALTKRLEGRELTEIGLMREAGAVMFANGATPITDAQLMRRILSYASTFDLLVANPPVVPSLKAVAHESAFSARLGLSGEPGAAEAIAVSRDAELARLTGARLLVDIVSAKEALDVLRRAKGEGVRIFASTSINHLALNEIDIGDYRTFAKLDPPLRGEDDRLALLEAVADGTIDVVVSDHDPQPSGRKRLPFAEAASGAVGLELLLAVATTLSADGHIAFADLLPALTSRPADLLGLPCGRIAEGAPADFAVIDPQAPWVCDSDTLLSTSKNTPFDGRRLTGRVVKTIRAGQEVYSA